jgi:hypothetical protein
MTVRACKYTVLVITYCSDSVRLPSFSVSILGFSVFQFLLVDSVLRDSFSHLLQDVGTGTSRIHPDPNRYIVSLIPGVSLGMSPAPLCDQVCLSLDDYQHSSVVTRRCLSVAEPCENELRRFGACTCPDDMIGGTEGEKGHHTLPAASASSS